jgi:tetratricopeptide (TPR) repeat protein/transcriptional regulator with XRE-family HTH domain
MSNEEKRLSNELLQYERERRNWSREYVAQQVGAPEDRMVGRWEREGVLPHPGYRQRLCDIFGKSARELGFVKSGEIPFWNVSYRRNPFFTGRETILSQLHEFLTTDKHAVLTQPEAISGLGGIGKTQVALEYAYRYGAEYQAILWVRGETRELLTSDFAALATLLNLPEKDIQDQSQVVAAVKNWLATLSRWLLILDNVEDLQLIGEFLPLEAKGHVLLTTRSQATGPIAHYVEVEAMEPEEGALCLLRRAKFLTKDAPLDTTSYTDWTRARAITEAMGGLPLALDQVGAYIEETRCGLDEYLALYQTHGSALLRERGGLAPDHPEAVVGTFLLSFEKVQQASPAAADLLRLCAFLAPDAISEDLITEGASELGPILAPVAADPLLLNRAIMELLKYSLVRRNPAAQTLTIHRLVQAVLRNEMGVDLQRQWAERAVRVVNQAFPKVEFLTVIYINWQRCERCLPHAQACEALITDYGLAFSEAARLLSKAGHYLRDRGQFQQAEQFARKALDIDEKVLGLEHLDVTISLDILGEVYYELGKYAESLELFSRALSIRRQLLEPEHPDIANNMNNLAALYHVHGKYDQAEPLYLEALSIRKKILGSSHPDIATSINTLAGLYDDEGRYDQAEILYQQALSMYEETLGPDHPDVAICCNNLSGLYRRQGKYDLAEPLLMRAREIWMQTTGPSHPDYGTVLNNLGKLNYLQGKYDQVEALYQQALEIYEQALGPTHPYVAGTLNNLANLYLDLGKYDQAEILYQRSLAIREKTFGHDHPEVAQSLYDLGRLYDIQGLYTQAEPLYLRAMAIREQQPGLLHPEAAKIVKSYADLLRKTHRQDEGIALEAHLLEKQARKVDSK